MTGIEKILTEIREESQKVTQELEAGNEKKIRALEEEIRQETRQKCEEIAQKGEEECQRILERSLSSSKLLERRMLLEAKQEILESTLEQARASVSAMEEEAYFAWLLRVICKRALPGDGVLLLSSRDKARLPQDFLRKLQEALPQGTRLELSPDSREISGGCVLLYGGIEENCSVDALFAAGREELTDLARGILFREG